MFKDPWFWRYFSSKRKALGSWGINTVSLLKCAPCTDDQSSALMKLMEISKPETPLSRIKLKPFTLYLGFSGQMNLQHFL